MADDADTFFLGPVRGLSVDQRDHVWIVHDPSSISADIRAAAASPPQAECCVPAPQVLEFDAAGKYIQGWNLDGIGYEALQQVHGMEAVMTPTASSIVRLICRWGAVVAACTTAALFVSSPLTAQAPVVVDKPAPPGWKVPRMPDGVPDLQGTYGNNSITPLERPRDFAGKPVLSDAEFLEMQQAVKDVLDGGDAPFGDELFMAAAARNKGHQSSDRQVGNYSQVWLSERVLEKRTSLIIDPADGRIPAASPQLAARNAARAAARKANPPSQIESLGNSTRCVTMGMPNLFAGYQSFFGISQGPGYVVVRSEMIHDARVIPTDGRPHLPPGIRQLHGDPRGRWEGDTLVVDTTNFSPQSNLRGSSENLHLVERFTRVSPDLIEWRITANDPTTWVRPWTMLVNLRRTGEPLVEYACHEGNYGLAGILSAQRAETGGQ